MFNEIRALSQAIIQNGGSVYDIVELYSTKSQRQLKKVFKDLRDRQQAMQEQQQQIEQQKVEQQGQIAQAQIQAAKEQKALEMENQNHENELDRINKKEIALLNALGRNPEATQDIDQSGVADALEISNMAAEETRANRDHEAKMNEIQSKQQTDNRKMDLEEKKLQVEKDNQANDLEIAKINAKNRGGQGGKPKK